MRNTLVVVLFGMALLRTSIASSEDSSCSDEFKRITNFVERQLKSFGENLNGRLTSFENRLTQSECTKKSTNPTGGSLTFDYGSRVKSILDDLFEIYDARMKERKTISSYTQKERKASEEPKGIEIPGTCENSQNRLLSYSKDIEKLIQLCRTESNKDSQADSTGCKSLQNIIAIANGVATSSVIGKDSSAENIYYDTTTTEYDTTTNEYDTSTDKSNEGLGNSETINTTLEQFLAWMEANRIKEEQNDEASDITFTSTNDPSPDSSSTESSSTESSSTDSSSTESSTSESIEISTEPEFRYEELNMKDIIEKYRKWRKENKDKELSLSTVSEFKDESENHARFDGSFPTEDPWVSMIRKFSNFNKIQPIKSDTTKTRSVQDESDVISKFRMWKKSEEEQNK